MADLELDLESALEAVESTTLDKGDCGCGGTSTADADLFGSADTFSDATDLGGQLDSALAEVEMSGEALTLEEELEFAAGADVSGVTISDIAALVEKYPGLKVTFSG